LRLIGAMIEVAGSKEGYASANIKLLSTLAGVSRQTFYDRFGSLEACFLATYEYVVSRAARHVRIAFRAEDAWEAKLRAAFEAYASEAMSEPKAARIALVEIFGAGPVALGERNRGRRVFEQMIAASFRGGPGGIEQPPPLIAQAIVGGVERITRLRLVNGGVEELPMLAEELLSWVVSYRSTMLAELPCLAAAGNRSLLVPARPRALQNGRERILRASAQIAANAGYAQLTRWRIINQSKVSEDMFDALYDDTERCFLDALDLLGREALDCAASAAASAENPVAAVRQGVAALLDRVAIDRVLQRVAFIEVFAVGSAGIQRRESLLGEFTDLLLNSLPEDQRPSELILQAIAGAVWGILHDQVTRGSGRLLPVLADQISCITLAPVIGAEAAIQAILADPR
jgi:AcrR family transcriptional regulator